MSFEKIWLGFVKFQYVFFIGYRTESYVLVGFRFFISFVLSFRLLNHIFFLNWYFQILTLHEIFLSSIVIQIIICDLVCVLPWLWVHSKNFLLLLFLDLCPICFQIISFFSFLIRVQTRIHTTIQILQIVNILLIIFDLGIEVEIHNMRIQVIRFLNNSLIEQKWIVIVIFNGWRFSFHVLRV